MASKRYHAFISHASVDHEAATQICATLEGRGLNCWIAPRDVPVGENYGKAIIEGVRESRTLVLLLSAAANDSPAVHNEVEFAFNSKVPCLVLRLEDVAASEELRFFIGARQHVDGFNGDLTSAAVRVAQGIEAMATAEVDALAEPASEISPAPPSQPEPTPAPAAVSAPAAAARPASRSRLPGLAIAGALGVAAVIGLVLFGGRLIPAGPPAPQISHAVAPAPIAPGAQGAQGPAAGGGTSQDGSGADAPDEAADCISIQDGQVRNTCAFAVTVVFCGGSSTGAAPECFPLNQPIPGPRIEVPANGSLPDDQQVDGEAPWFFPCRPPAEPVAIADNNWRCIAPTSAGTPPDGETGEGSESG